MRILSRKQWLIWSCLPIHIIEQETTTPIIYFPFLDPDDPFKLTDDERQLGLVVCRGTSVVLICPHDGMEPIANPFISAAE